MMKNGLLHSIPENVTEKYPRLLSLVEICAESSPEMNRFVSSKFLMDMLTEIINDRNLNPNTNRLKK